MNNVIYFVLLFAHYFVANNCMNVIHHERTLYGNPDPATGRAPLTLNAEDLPSAGNERAKRMVNEPPGATNRSAIVTKVCQ